jgi:hypothetical protein
MRLIGIESGAINIPTVQKNAYSERRLALGIEIDLVDPPGYFAHRKNAVSGMASFDIAKNTLATIGLDSPIWLVGVED